MFPLLQWQCRETDSIPIETLLVIALNIDDGQPWTWPHKCHFLVNAENDPQSVLLKGITRDLVWEATVQEAPWAAARTRALIRQDLNRFTFKHKLGEEQ